jgi:multidrug efflux pump subunit AcrA (membrane-fusion protein)
MYVLVQCSPLFASFSPFLYPRNVSELGLVTTSGKVAWAKFAQVTNNPELDGTVNAVLLV